jgi:hypothetical protein
MNKQISSTGKKFIVFFKYVSRLRIPDVPGEAAREKTALFIL